MNDPSSLAHSLNRFGNWHANVGNLNEALRFHQQALLIFESLNHRRGLAETLDLLGMASQINGDLVQGVAHYQRAPWNSSASWMIVVVWYPALPH